MWGETTIAKAVTEELGPAHGPAAARATQSGTVMVAAPASGSRKIAPASAPEEEADVPEMEKTSLLRRIPVRVWFEILGALLLCAAFFVIQLWLLHSSAPTEAQIIPPAATPRPAHTPAPRTPTPTPTPTPAPPQEMASLLVKVVHAFHSADLIIWVDGHAVDTARLSGGAVLRKKQHGKTVVSTHYEHYENVIPISAGEHIIRVRVSSKGVVLEMKWHFKATRLVSCLTGSSRTIPAHKTSDGNQKSRDVCMLSIREHHGF
jgi:hypothetical protein